MKNILAEAKRLTFGKTIKKILPWEDYEQLKVALPSKYFIINTVCVIPSPKRYEITIKKTFYGYFHFFIKKILYKGTHY